MNITLKTLPKSEVQLTVELTEDQMNKYYEKAAKQVSNMVKIPGFRPGHVPLDVLKQHVNEEALEAHMIDIALPEVYSDAILKEKVKAVSRPKIEIIQKSPLKFEAVVAVYPEVKVDGYQKAEIKRNEVKVEAKDVDEVLKDLQKRHATYPEVDQPAKMGDKVEVDFEGYDEGGAQLESTKSKNHPLVLGEGTLVQGFEEELVGLKKGDKKTFTVTFPKDYFHKAFQNKKVRFDVVMQGVREVKLPEMNEDFIKLVTGSDKTLDEAKKTIESNLKDDKDYEEKVRRENVFLEKLIDCTKVELPVALIEEEIDGMMDELKSEMGNRGITLEQFIEQTKKEMKDLREERRKEAEKRLTLRFGLHQVFEQEKIDLTPEELKHEIEQVISLYPAKEQYKMRKEYESGSYLLRRLENKLRMEKLFERFIGK